MLSTPSTTPGEGEEKQRPLVRFQYDESVSHLVRDYSRGRGRAVGAVPSKAAAAAKDTNKAHKENNRKQRQRPAAKAGADASPAAGQRQAETVRRTLEEVQRATATPSLRFEPTP